jgi:hypothetical protein
MCWLRFPWWTTALATNRSSCTRARFSSASVYVGLRFLDKYRPVTIGVYQLVSSSRLRCSSRDSNNARTCTAYIVSASVRTCCAQGGRVRTRPGGYNIRSEARTRSQMGLTTLVSAGIDFPPETLISYLYIVWYIYIYANVMFWWRER